VKIRFLYLGAAAFLVLFATTQAQVVITRSSGGVTIVSSQDGQIDAPEVEMQEAPPAPGKEKPEGKSTPRLEKLKKLEYDRRPSAILAAWSTPPKAPEPEKPLEADKKEEGKQEEAAAPTPTDPEAAKKTAEEAEKKKKKEEEAAKKAAEAKAIEEEAKVLQRNVTLGDWPAVKTYLAGIAENEGKAGYAQILKSLQKGPSQKPNAPPQGQA